MTLEEFLKMLNDLGILYKGEAISVKLPDDMGEVRIDPGMHPLRGVY